MPEIPSIDPCENLRREIDKKVHAFEQQGVKMKNEATDILKNVIEGFGKKPTLTEELDNAIAGATVDDVGAGSTALSRIRNFTGSCLDSIYNETRIFASTVDASVNDRINDFTSLTDLVEFDMLSPLQNVRKYVGITKLEELLADIDTKLGCLADSEIGDCTGLVAGFNSRIDDVISYLGFGTDASFDLDEFISNHSLGLGDPASAGILTSLKALDNHIETLKVEALSNTHDVLPQDVLPRNYF
jgi:hypothetical protein